MRRGKFGGNRRCLGGVPFLRRYLLEGRGGAKCAEGETRSQIARDKEAATRAAKEVKRIAWEKLEAERTDRAAILHKESAQTEALTKSVCVKCGAIDKPKRLTPGHGGIEFALWISILCLFVTLHWLYMIASFIAALSYSLWRASSKYPARRACKSPDLFPASSPKGKDALRAAGLLGTG